MTDETNQAGAMSALYEALAKAQSGMGALAKDAKGNFGKYATLASVIEVVLPPLSEQGIAVIQMPETSADGMTLITMLCHKAGGVIRTELTMKPAQNTPQGIGSTITYARRYSLMAIAGVAPDDDDGTAGSAVAKTQQATPTKTTADSRAFFTRIVGMVRNAPDVDELESLFKANRQEIDADKYKADILKEFSERKAELEAGQ
jgi:hypothetical protein